MLRPLAPAENTLRLDSDRCTACGVCVSVCPHGVFALREGELAVVRAEACMECGACAVNCPTGALDVDSGVGCAWALMRAAIFRRNEAASCGET